MQASEALDPCTVFPYRPLFQQPIAWIAGLYPSIGCEGNLSENISKITDHTRRGSCRQWIISESNEIAIIPNYPLTLV